MKAIVWYPKTVKNVTKALWQVMETPYVLTDNRLIEQEELQNSCEYFRTTCQVSQDFQPSYLTEKLPILAFNSSFDLEVYQSFIIVKPANEETLLFFFLLYYGGAQVVLFSADLDLFSLSQYIKNTIDGKKVFGTCDFLYSNLVGIRAISEISVWPGIPNWDYRNNLMIFSRNDQNLQKIKQIVKECFEPVFTDYTDAFKEPDITFPRLYIGDALIELGRYL